MCDSGVASLTELPLRFTWRCNLGLMSCLARLDKVNVVALGIDVPERLWVNGYGRSRSSCVGLKYKQPRAWTIGDCKLGICKACL